MTYFGPPVFIHPGTGFGLQRLFGTECNKDLLIDFLNHLINPPSPIKDLRYLSPEQMGRSSAERQTVFDLYCKAQDGSRFLVEMQRSWQEFFKDRSVFYAAFPITHQGLPGNWSFELQAVHVIGVLNFSFDDEHPNEPRSTVKLTVQETQKVFYDKLTMIYLEMPKFKKNLNELKTDFDRWLYVLKNLSTLSERPGSFSSQVFVKLFEAARIAAFTPAEALSYEESLKIYRDNYSALWSAKKQGHEEGTQETTCLLAKKMRDKGYSLADIAGITGLSEEKIRSL